MTRTNTEFTHKDGVSLKEHFDQRFTDIQRAVDKAEQTINTRLEGMNEFRAAMKDQQATMATKDDVNRVRQRLSDLETVADRAAGKADQASVDRVLVMSMIALGISVITFVLRLLGS